MSANLPPIFSSPAIDPIAAIGDQTKVFIQNACAYVAGGLTGIVNNINSVGRSSFWNAQGVNGVLVLAAYSNWIAILTAKAPDLVNVTLQGALAGLTSNPDGSVTGT